MAFTHSTTQEFLATLEGFDKLPIEILTDLSQKLQPQRYSLGQKIIGKDRIPERVTIIYEGKARLLAYNSQTQQPVMLHSLQKGSILGEISLFRELACEMAIASTELTGLSLNSNDYLALLAAYPSLAKIRQNICYLVEIFDVFSNHPQVQTLGEVNLKKITKQALASAKVHYLEPGETPITQLDNDCVWFVSGGGTVKNFSCGSCLQLNKLQGVIEVEGNPARLIGWYKISNYSNNVE